MRPQVYSNGTVNLLEVFLITYIGRLVPLVPNVMSIFLSYDLLCWARFLERWLNLTEE